MADVGKQERGSKAILPYYCTSFTQYISVKLMRIARLFFSPLFEYVFTFPCHFNSCITGCNKSDAGSCLRP